MQQLSEPLIFAVLHRKQAVNAGVTVAVLGMTWFFNQALLQYSMALIAALRSYSPNGLFSPSRSILAFLCCLIYGPKIGPHKVYFALYDSGFYSLFLKCF